MTFIREGYVCRRVGTKGNPKSRGRPKKGKGREQGYLNWYIVRDLKYQGNVQIGHILFDKEYIGKRIRLKIEVLE